MDKANQHLIIGMLIGWWFCFEYCLRFSRKETRLWLVREALWAFRLEILYGNVVDKPSDNDSAYFSLLFYLVDLGRTLHYLCRWYRSWNYTTLQKGKICSLFFLFWLIRRFSFFRKLLLSKLWNWMVLSKSAGCWIPFYNYKVGLELRVFQPGASLSNDSHFPSRWLLRQLNVHIFFQSSRVNPQSGALQ